MTDPVVCPHCREHLDIPAEYRGRAVRCASCQNVFTTPPLPGSTPPSAPERRPDGPADAPPWRTEQPPRPRPRLDDDGYDRPRLKPNGGVWVLLLLTTLVLGACVGGCTGLAAWLYNPKMHPFTSAEGKFRVEFPGNPSPTVDPGDAGAVTVSGNREQTQERFTVKVFDRPAKNRGLPPDEALEQLALAELKAAGGRERTRGESTTHDGFPAYDVTDADDMPGFQRRNTIVRCVLVGKRVYAVVAQGPNMQPQAWWVRKFFVSFEITDRPADGKPKKQD